MESSPGYFWRGSEGMEKFLRFLSGYVRITIEGEQLERFLNLCKSRGISIRNVKYTGEKMLTAVLSIHDFFLLRPLRNKTGVHIRIREKHGMPFFFYRNKKRKAFFLGILFCMVLLFVLSGHIWNIHVQGNVRNSTPEILGFLEAQGITHGISKNRVNCADIAAMIRREYPDITWVSARMEGTRLILTIQEGETKENIRQEEAPCDLTSDVEGEIVKMVTRSGTPVMKVGDVCKKGDILVLGSVNILNDSQEVVRTEYVHADADVYVRYDTAYYQEFPLSCQIQTATGQVKTGFYLKIGSWCIGAGCAPMENYHTAVEEIPWRLTENYKLPVVLGKITRTQYKTEESSYTEEEAKNLAIRRLYRYEEKLMKQGIQIEENRVKIRIQDNVCVSSGKLTVIKKAGKET